MELRQVLTEYVDAAFAGIWVQTQEPDEAVKLLYQLAQDQGWQYDQWDCARGTHSGGQPGDPLIPLKTLKQKDNKLPGGGEEDFQTSLMVLWNYHKFVTNVMVMQELQLAVIEGKLTRKFVVILSPVVNLPVELEKLFVVVEHELPSQEQLHGIANELTHAPADARTTDRSHNDSVNAASGLTRYEAENTFSLSLTRHGKLAPDTIWEMKAQMLKKSGVLELHRGGETLSQLGGLDALKSFTRKSLAHPGSVRPRGVLLLGVPGTGKSHFAKALGAEVGRPTVALDVGCLMGSLVGESQARARLAFRTTDAMSPCVLFIDEVEKALAGGASSHVGDSGAAKNVFGTVLTWLNDHTSDVFVICTSNDISQLPPEFCRAERWDGIWFIDLPTFEERDAIWSLYRKAYAVEDNTIPPSVDWTGAEIKSCCRLAALLGISLQEAAQYVVPVAVTAADRIHSLRAWATGRALCAFSGGRYSSQKAQAINPNGEARRRVKASDL